MKNTVNIEKIDDSSVKIYLDSGTVIASSFSDDRLEAFFKELKSTSQSDFIEVLKVWYESKLINFWADFDFEDCLNI